MKRNILLIAHLASLVLLGLGLFLNVLKIDITASFFIDINLFDESRSVIGTLQSLWQSGNYFPFLLISTFGILIPLIKSGALFYMLLVPGISVKWQRFVSLSSKWAMADVFALSIFISFLGANAMKNTTATLEPGFYYFAAYVLLSAVIVSIFAKMHPLLPPHHA